MIGSTITRIADGRRRYRVAFGALALLAACTVRAAGDIDAGRRLYESAILADGSSLSGVRLGSVVVSGEPVACVACHRPSGMGSVEADIQIPPITGNALFGTGDRVIATMDPRSGKAFNRAHEPYSEADIARLLRTGQRADGTRLNELMPRYRLADGDLQSLLAYLRQLSSHWSPGVTADTIRFATVITPDVPAERRALFISMARKMVAQKNGSTKVAGQGTRHHMTSAAELVLGTERRWTLDVWELEGPSDSWGRQLDERYARQPVFALLSGLGTSDWAPVDAFCDRNAVPCWFPSVPLAPTDAPRYSLYFSAGVALEARVLAATLRAAAAAPAQRIIQLYRDDPVARTAARSLHAALTGSGITVEDREVAGSDAGALAAALRTAGEETAFVCWLRGDDVARLGALPPPTQPSYFSGTLIADEPLPAAWRTTARVLYPYELPARRAANLAYFRAWLNQRHVPVTDELMQSQEYFAFAFMTDTVAEMLDNLYRDYLIERAETMINRREGGRAEAEYYSSTQSHVRTQVAPTAARDAPTATAARPPVALQALRIAGSAFGIREGTSAYPRLSLGNGQRFASKGAYVARYDEASVLVADDGWVVP
ncbi:MAG TPA: hypothetical protein VFK87_00315 [Steroidobacteraceae bacterium]|nr:hypothetical protein [Steroidobacteraceae bacterium]